jgi:hypothetical protein
MFSLAGPQSQAPLTYLVGYEKGTAFFYLGQ